MYKKTFNITAEHLYDVLDKVCYSENINKLKFNFEKYKNNPDLEDLLQLSFSVYHSLFSDDYVIQDVIKGVNENLKHLEENFLGDAFDTQKYQLIEFGFDTNPSILYMDSITNDMDGNEIEFKGIYSFIFNEKDSCDDFLLSQRKDYLIKKDFSINLSGNNEINKVIYSLKNKKFINISKLNLLEFVPEYIGSNVDDFVDLNDMSESLLNKVDEIVKKKIIKHEMELDLMDSDKFYGSFNQDNYNEEK